MLTINFCQRFFDGCWVNIAHQLANKLQLPTSATPGLNTSGEHDGIEQLLALNGDLAKLRLWKLGEPRAKVLKRSHFTLNGALARAVKLEPVIIIHRKVPLVRGRRKSQSHR